MPNTTAIIYASNSKKGSYTGFVHDISVFHKFDHESFLARHALAGPESRIRCEIMSQGLYGNAKQCFYMKKFGLCHIPGYKYSMDFLSPLPKPVSWVNQKMNQ